MKVEFSLTSQAAIFFKLRDTQLKCADEIF